MTRRDFLLTTGGILCATAVSTIARAEPDYFPWRYPGRDPLRNTTDEEALRRLGSGDMIPAHVHTVLVEQIHAERFSWDEIPNLQNGFRFTRMLFGRGVVAGNVVALTGESGWANVSRRVRRYEYDDHGTVYVLIRPDVCGNWSLRIVTTQGACVIDTSLCSPECLELRKHQA